MRHNHYTRETKPPGLCPACDAHVTGIFQDEVAFMLGAALLTAGMKQVDLERTTGLSAKYVGELLQGKVTMSAPVALLIERAIEGLTAEELLYAEARKQIRFARGS